MMGMLCIWGVIYICIAIYIWFSKKAIAFRGSKKFIEVTEYKKIQPCDVQTLCGNWRCMDSVWTFLLAGHSKWISVVGVVMVNIVFIVVYLLAIEKKYKK